MWQTLFMFKTNWQIEKSAWKKIMHVYIEKMSIKTWHEHCVHTKELWALYIDYNSITDTQILVDHLKCIT